jgi:hypothetical protein
MTDERDDKWTENAVDRMRRAMLEDDGSPPELWNPEAGDQLVGELLRLEERETRVGTAQVAVVADADNGQLWSVFLTRTVLKSEFERQAPRAGDIVGIKYHGTKSFRSGEGTYHYYTVRVSRAPGSDQPSGRSPAPSSVPPISTQPTADAEFDQELELPF